MPLHLDGMVNFDLGRRFDAIVCLFSAIGYVVTVERLRAAIATMARHLSPGGVLLVEPWLTPDAYTSGTLHSVFVDQPELKIARIRERHELGLFTNDEYREAAIAVGLKPAVDPQGLTGRGLLIGVRAPVLTPTPDSVIPAPRATRVQIKDFGLGLGSSWPMVVQANGPTSPPT